MVFPHSSFILSPINSDCSISGVGIDPVQLAPLPSAPIPSTEKRSFSFFFPCFQEKDQVLRDFYQARICDQYGNPDPEFDHLEFPPLVFHSICRKSLNILIQFLNQPRKLGSTVLGDSSHPQRLNIPIRFCDFLKHLITLSSFSHPVTDKHGHSQFIPASPIKDILLIGSSVPKFIRLAPMMYIAQHFFGTHLTPEQMGKWLNMEHVKQFFNKQENDVDIRLLSPGELEVQSFFNDKSIQYLIDSIQPPFDPSFYMQELVRKDYKYRFFENQTYNLFLLKQQCILEFGGIVKRNRIDKPGTQYTILTIKTLHYKPTEFLFVGLKNKKPTLRNLNLSSTNCWTISVYNLLTDSQSKNWNLKLGCQPFTPAKALIDLLCGISTILDPSPEAWCRFLRDCTCSMQIQVEYQMVQNVTKLDREFLYNLLKQEIQKSQIHSKNKQVNSLGAIHLLFRACQSLQAHSDFSDQECLALWQFANSQSWLQLKETSLHKKTINVTLKNALLEEKVPFSILTAWMSLLTWIWNPLSATSHCQQPIFRLQVPFICLLPIEPIKQGKIVQEYIDIHPCPSSFQELYEIMGSSHQASLISFPLTPYLTQLKIKSLDLEKLAGNWITHFSSLLNIVGLHLYLGISRSSLASFNLAFIFPRLPQLLRHCTHPQQHQEILNTLKSLTQASPGYQQVLQALANRPLNQVEWLALLIQTKDPEILKLAYQLWRECEKQAVHFAHKHVKIGHSLYQALCIHQPHLALSILLTLTPTLLLISLSSRMNHMLPLMQSYQIYAPQQFICDIETFLPLFHPFFEQEKPLKFKNEQQRQTFSQSLVFLIETLYQIPYKHTLADYFLLEASRRNYIDLAWQIRIWENRLKSLTLDSKQILYTQSLYQRICEENLIKDLTPQTQEQIHIWALQCVQAQSPHPIETRHLKTLTILLLATPPQKYAESENEICAFFQNVLTLLQAMPPDLSLSLHLQALDHLWGSKEFLPFFKQASEKWKKLLLDYLEISLPLNTQQRFPKLWEVYEQIMRLFNHTKTPTHFLRLCQLLAHLIEASSPTSHLPTPLLLEWMKLNHEKILKTFLQNQNTREIKILLQALERYCLSHTSLASYLWPICQEELTNTPSRVLSFLNLDSFENLLLQIQPSSYSSLPLLLSHLLTADPMQPSYGKWIVYCLDILKKENTFYPALLDKCLTYATHLISQNEPCTAFSILNHLPQLSSIQQQKATSLLLAIAPKLSNFTDMNRQFFLQPQMLAINQKNQQQLQPLVTQVIQSHLALPFSRQTEKNLILDLLDVYDLKLADLWLATWKNQEIKEFPRIWEAFKKQAFSLKGKNQEIAECWTCALKYLHQVNHSDMLNYFNEEKWLTLFSDSSTADLKWQALEAVFLNVVQTLSPTSFDSALFHRIIQKKSDLNLPVSLSQTIDIALNTQLKTSTDSTCLLAIARLLYDALQIAPTDQRFYTTYFEKVSSVSLLEPSFPYLEFAFQLMAKVMEQASNNEMQTLKPCFLTLISHIVRYPLLQNLDHVQKCLTISFKKMGLSITEKSELSQLFLKASTYYYDLSAPCNSFSIKHDIELYVQWAPYLFVQPTVLQEALHQVTSLICSYAHPTETDKQDQKSFQEGLTQILDLKFQVELLHVALYRRCLTHYFTNVMETMKSCKPDTLFLLQAFNTYILSKLNQKNFQNTSKKDMLQLIELFVYFLPPQSSILIPKPNSNTYKTPLHLVLSRKLLQQAYDQKLFIQHPQELLSLQLWLAFPISKNISFNPSHRPVFEKTIQKFLDCKTPYSIFRAIQLCRVMQTYCISFEHECKKLTATYHNILKAIRPHLKYIIDYQKKSDHTTLLEFFITQTLQSLPYKKFSERQYLAKTSKLYFEFTLEFIKEVSKDSTATLLLQHYLFYSFQLIKLQAIHYTFENNYSSYFSIFEQILPFIKLIAFQPTPSSYQESLITLSTSSAFVTEWVSTLLHTPHYSKSDTLMELKPHEKEQQRTFLFKGLRLLQTRTANEDPVKLYDGLIAALLFLLDPEQPDYPYWMNAQQAEAVELFESIKQTLFACNLNIRQQVVLDSIHHHFYYMTSPNKNYASHLENLSNIIQKIEIDLFQKDFPFLQFHSSLVRMVLHCPHDMKETYLFQRQELFVLLLTTMQSSFEKIPSDFLIDIQDLLMDFLGEGIHANLLQSQNKKAVTQFEWAKKWLKAAPQFSCFIELLDLIFYKEIYSEKSENLVSYVQNIKALFKPLCESIIRQKNFNYSSSIVSLITCLPIRSSEKAALFITWVQTFPTILNSLKDMPEDHQAIHEHLQVLIQGIQQKHMFEDIILNINEPFLIPVSTKVNPSKLNIYSVTLMLQEIFKSS